MASSCVESEKPRVRRRRENPLCTASGVDGQSCFAFHAASDAFDLRCDHKNIREVLKSDDVVVQGVQVIGTSSLGKESAVAIVTHLSLCCSSRSAHRGQAS